ncbi:MAG: glycosyltransferase family 2 protein [Candidatus Binatia bacterium]
MATSFQMLQGVPPGTGNTGDTAALLDLDPGIPATAIVVNWNGRDHLEGCLGSLLQQTLPGPEVLLVDNGSTDGSLAFARERFGDSIRILTHATNLGYGSALNAGIRAARGRYLFALNNDTEVAPGCLAALVGAADEHPSAGSFAPKILSFDARNVIDNAGHVLYPDGVSRGRGRLETDRGQYDREEDILLPSGCAVLLRREMLVDIGLFDEDLFAYCEDTDLGLRAQLAGWRCRYVPAARVYHKYSASTAGYSPLKAYLVERNRAWVALKCLPAPILVLSPVFTLLRLGAQAIGALTRRGAAGRFVGDHSLGTLLGVFFRAVTAAARGLPHAWRKRRAIQRRRRIPIRSTLAWITRYGMGVREIALKD